MNKKKEKKINNGSFIGENVSYSKILHKTIKEGVDDIKFQAERYRNNTTASMTGFVAEADHCATFNVKNAIKGSSVRAVREPNGYHGDYKIVDGKKVILEGEVKYYKNAEATEQAMRGYGDKQRIGPSDQIEDIKKIAKQKAVKNEATGKPNRLKVAKEHEEVAKNASESITDGKTKSTPRTRKEMEKIAKKAKRGKINDTDIMPSAKEALKDASITGLKSGAKTGALFGGGISTILNAKAVIDGEKEIKDAIVDTGKDVIKSAADGAIKSAASKAATTGSVYIAEKVGSTLAKRVLKSSAPAAVAVGTVEVIKDVGKLVNGDIDGEEFAKRTAKTAVSTAGGWAGAEVGATVGSMICPGVGTVIGGIIGGIAGSFLGGIFD